MSGLSTDIFRHSMRQVPGAVAIVATGQGADRRGLCVTAWCSLTVEPPRLLVCINHSSGAHDLIVRSGVFSVNQLSVEQIDVAAVFAGRAGLGGDNRFSAAGAPWTTLRTGAPILEECVASFDCELLEHHPQPTHTIFIASIVAATSRDGKQPLAYVDGRFSETRPVPAIFRDPRAEDWEGLGFC